MNRIAMAQELVRMAKEVMAIEFPTQDAMDAYLKEHPDADRSNHRVVKEKHNDSPRGDKQQTPKERRRERLNRSVEFEDVEDGNGRFDFDKVRNKMENDEWGDHIERMVKDGVMDRGVARKVRQLYKSKNDDDQEKALTIDGEHIDKWIQQIHRGWKEVTSQ